MDGVKLKEAPAIDGARIVKEADDSEKAASSDAVAQNPSVKSVHEVRGQSGQM
jgi:hypothetical protein